MRKQIAAANWKMNLTARDAIGLLTEILNSELQPATNQEIIFAIPFPYLEIGKSLTSGKAHFSIAAQNCHQKKNGAFTGEVSAEMLQSLGIEKCIIGHSERRQYFNEPNDLLAEKINICLEYRIQPIFCCGEPLLIREQGSQNSFVQEQLEQSLFHLSSEQLKQVVIAYEPIWAIGTGRTASAEQAQEMHQFIRSVLEKKYKSDADEISILYGGSVKAENAKELFACSDVDGGLVGGASLVAQDFVQIIKALKQ